MRYLKVTLIGGASTALLVAGLFELHAFAHLDAALATFLARPSPPVVERGLQHFLILLFAFGITWTTIDLNRLPLKLGIALAALAETVTAVWVGNLYGAYFSPFASITAILVAAAGGNTFSQTESGRQEAQAAAAPRRSRVEAILCPDGG